jgi:hypothetical protein
MMAGTSELKIGQRVVYREIECAVTYKVADDVDAYDLIEIEGIESHYNIPRNEIIVPDEDVTIQTEPPCRFTRGERVIHIVTNLTAFVLDPEAGFDEDGVRLVKLNTSVRRTIAGIDYNLDLVREDDLVPATASLSHEELLAAIETLFVQQMQYINANEVAGHINMSIHCEYYAGNEFSLMHRATIGGVTTTTNDLAQSVRISLQRVSENKLYSPKKLPAK